MATASINDLKIRVLQLKGMGYDKLLEQKDLTNKLSVLANELTAIDGEVTSLITVIEEAETAASTTTVPPSGTVNPPPQSNPIQAPIDGNGHIKVDEKQLETILSPKSGAGKTKVAKSKPKTKKTSHTIGRRS